MSYESFGCMRIEGACTQSHELTIFLCWLETDCTIAKLDVSTQGIQWYT